MDGGIPLLLGLDAVTLPLLVIMVGFYLVLPAALIWWVMQTEARGSDSAESGGEPNGGH